MHVAEMGPLNGPLIIFLHGFPEIWYSWRHQIVALASLGYRVVALDLRGFGDTDVPKDVRNYMAMHVVGDLIALLDVVAPNQNKVFAVGHDWGAGMGWYLSLFRPDRVKALIAMSVDYKPRYPKMKTIESLRAIFSDDYYVLRMQEPGVVEAEFAQMGVERTLREFLTYRDPGPNLWPKRRRFGNQSDVPIALPSWLSEEVVKYYATQYKKSGFTGGLNYYRSIDPNWELTAPWTGSQIKVPAKFIVGDQDLKYNTPGTKDHIHKGGFKRVVPFLQEVVIMKGVAHFLHQDKPYDINKHIYDFFRKF